MGLTEIFCENVENMWQWIENNRDEAKEKKDILMEYIITHHLTIQYLLGNTDPESVIRSRVKITCQLKWYNVVILGEKEEN